MNRLTAATLECNALRELMRIELPDRWTDIDTNDPPVAIPATSAYLSYNSAYNAAIKSNSNNPLDTTYQGADCLYWIVTMGLEENDVMENFSQSDIGIDPNNPNWGSAVLCRCVGQSDSILAMGAGFTSALQPNPPTDRDQTDPTGVYGSPKTSPPTFALYPLIFSAGSDGYYDILTDTKTALRYSQTSPANNPFTNYPGTTALGSQTFSAANTTGSYGNYDNITNQEIGSH